MYFWNSWKSRTRQVTKYFFSILSEVTLNIWWIRKFHSHFRREFFNRYWSKMDFWVNIWDKTVFWRSYRNFQSENANKHSTKRLFNMFHYVEFVFWKYWWCLQQKYWCRWSEIFLGLTNSKFDVWLDLFPLKIRKILDFVRNCFSSLLNYSRAIHLTRNYQEYFYNTK